MRFFYKHVILTSSHLQIFTLLISVLFSDFFHSNEHAVLIFLIRALGLFLKSRRILLQ